MARGLYRVIFKTAWRLIRFLCRSLCGLIVYQTRGLCQNNQPTKNGIGDLHQGPDGASVGGGRVGAGVGGTIGVGGGLVVGVACGLGVLVGGGGGAWVLVGFGLPPPLLLVGVAVKKGWSGACV